MADEVARGWLKLYYKLAAALAVSLIACCALTIALISEHRANDTAACVNANLGARNGPNLADAAALVVYIHSQKTFAMGELAALGEIGTAPKRVLPDFQRAVAGAEAAADKYLHTLSIDAAAKAAKPLGRC